MSPSDKEPPTGLDKAKVQHKEQLLYVAIEQVSPEVKAVVQAPTMNKIHRALVNIPFDRLRLMIADGMISSAEVRMALSQAGLSVEEINEGIEYTRRVLEHYARLLVTDDHSLAGAAHIIDEKVERMGMMLDAGNITPEIKEQDKSAALVANTPGKELGPDGRVKG